MEEALLTKKDIDKRNGSIDSLFQVLVRFSGPE